MEKFWARIRLNDGENAQELLKAFFAEEFSSQNKILIKGKRIFVEIFFDEAPPAEIATIIGGYSDIDFGYGKLSDKYLEDNCQMENKEGDMSVAEEENTANYGNKEEEAQPEETAAEEGITVTGIEDAAQPDETEADKSVTVTEIEDAARPQETAADEAVMVTGTEEAAQAEETAADEAAIQGDASDFKRSKKAPDSIPKLDEIAQTSVSFDVFVDAVAQWFEFGKRTTIFKQLVQTAVKIEYSIKADVKVTWGNLLVETTNQEGFVFTTNDKIAMTRQVAKKLSEIQSNGSILSVIKLTAKYYDYDFKGNIKDKVRNILVKMGLEDKSHEEQHLIVQVATGGLAIAATIGSPNAIDMHNLCRSLGAVHPDVMQMTFSTFVNDFYRTNHNKEMRAKDFIMKLYEMIVTGEEKF